MILKVKILDKNIATPSYAHEGDAGFDLRAKKRTVVSPGERAFIPTGLSVEIPEGFAGLIWDKSGLAMKHGLKTLGGVIDSSYRGEIVVGIVNLSDKDHIFQKGDKTAQMLIQKVERVNFEEVEEVSKTERGEGGFGSTGKK